MPEPLRIEEIHLLFVVAHEFATTGVVAEQPPILVDDVEGGRAVLEDLAELALVLGDRGRVRSLPVRGSSRTGAVVPSSDISVSTDVPRRAGRPDLRSGSYRTAKQGSARIAPARSRCSIQCAVERRCRRSPLS